jgi:hypothetical protein
MADEASSTTRVAPSTTPVSSSSGSIDSYNGDDARHFLRQLNKVRDLYSEATCEAWRLVLRPPKQGCRPPRAKLPPPA